MDPDRKGFVTKVYAIVCIQLCITTLATGIVLSSETHKEWVRDHYYLYYVALIFGITILCTLVCCTKHARKVPRNYILLGIFTICWSYMVAGFTQWFEPSDVFAAAGLTSAMVAGLTLFACCCKMKLTWLWGIAAAGSLAVWPLIIFLIIFPSRFLFNIVAFFVVVLTSIYIVYDTRLIMKKLSPDEYIIGALLLYADIIQLFMWILALFGNN